MRQRLPIIAVTAVGAFLAGLAAWAVPVAATSSSPQSLIERVPATAVYALHDSAGHPMSAAKIVEDPSTTGRYLAVYDWSTATSSQVGVATSTDLRTWTFRRTLDTAASEPYLAFSPRKGPILAVAAGSPSRLRFTYWTTVANMIGTGSPYRILDVPMTLGTCDEGAPDIRQVTYAGSTSTITNGSTIVVGHTYSADCRTHRQALGTLTNFKTWKTVAQPAVDQQLSDAGASGDHGDRDTFAYDGTTWSLYGGRAASGHSGSGIYLSNGSTASRLNIHTAGGSTAFARPSATVLTDRAGVTSLLVSVSVRSKGAAAGETGRLIYWQPLTAQPAPTSSSPAPTASSPAPTASGTPTASPSPTASNSPTSTRPTKILTFVEENHSLAQMQSGMPYLYGLARQYAYADNYTAITHPSEPNYVAMTFGSTMSDTADHTTARSFTGPTVFSAAVKAGGTAKSYVESMPSACALSDASPYYVKHNPQTADSTDRAACAASNLPMGTTTSGALLNDITAGTLPTVGMAIPNICNDAHNCSLATADNWLKGWLPKIIAGPDFRSGRLVVVVTADEDDRASGNKVLTTVLDKSLDGAHKVVSSPLSHYSLARWQTDIAGAPCIRNGCTATDMGAAFGLS